MLKKLNAENIVVSFNRPGDLRLVQKIPNDCRDYTEYAAHILQFYNVDKDIAYQEIQKLMADNRHVFNKEKYVQFMACFTILLWVIAGVNQHLYYMALKAIKNALKSGRISKQIALFLLQKLSEKGAPIPHDMLD